MPNNGARESRGYLHTKTISYSRKLSPPFIPGDLDLPLVGPDAWRITTRRWEPLTV